MPRTLRSVAGFVTAAGAGTNVVAPSVGATGTFAVDSFTSGKAYLEALWGTGAAFDFLRFRSPRMHDANQGIRLQIGGTQRSNLLPWGIGTQIYSSDTPTVEADATGAGTQLIVATYGYDDLNTGSPNLANWPDISSRILDISGSQVAVTSGAIGAYGAGVAIDTGFGNLKADFSYAVLGYTCSTAVGAFAINGTDTGNFDIAFPGDTDPRETRDYFIRFANQTGRASIPIIQANNRFGTIVKSVDSAAATVSTLTLTLARLG
jgi:hypothetical protein